MATKIGLKKGRLSGALRRTLDDYYRPIDGGPAYVDARWKEWEEGGKVVVFTAGKGPAGWIIYDPSTSTIRDMVLSSGATGWGLLDEILDALLVRENLVAAEVAAADRAKYEKLVEYGFRPTRSFSTGAWNCLKMELSTATLLKRLGKEKPAKTYSKKERVALEKVPPTQSYEEIKKGLANLLGKLGGLKKFVKKGQTVLVKPNIVSDHGLKDGVYKGGIVTDVRLIRALVELLLPLAGKVIIAEGSSINRSETGKMFEHYGYDKLIDLDPSRVSLLDLNTDRLVEKPVPGGKRMLSRKISETLDSADLIISVPVLKIHFAAAASLAVKHLQGAVPPLEKYMSHFFGLWQNLVNIHHLVKPGLTIIDGLTGQEDFGPVSGTPKKMGLLMGGTDPVAVDSVAMRVMGLDPATSPPVWLAWMQGLGPLEEAGITVVGPTIEEVRSPFKQPEINVVGGRDITIHAEGACPGCKGYLHFVLMKLRRPDPQDPTRQLMDRPFDRKVNIFLGPAGETAVNPRETNIFMGICQQHRGRMGKHLPGCPPHAEVIVNGIFSLFPDMERPKYADESEEKKLGEMLKQIMAME